MSLTKPTKLRISPAAFLLPAVFIALSPVEMLLAVLLAALCHELGHYLLVRALGGRLDAITMTALGAEMHIAPDSRLSYGRELLATAAGPAVNLLLGCILATGGRHIPILYLLSGVQLVLGLFNLLPIMPLDGGSILWLAVAWLTEPYTADRVTVDVGLAVSVLLLAAAIMVGMRTGGGGFLLVMALCLSARQWSGVIRKKDLSKEGAEGKISC